MRKNEGKKNAPETFDWFPHLSRLSRVEAMRRWPGNRGDVGLGTEDHLCRPSFTCHIKWHIDFFLALVASGRVRSCAESTLLHVVFSEKPWVFEKIKRFIVFFSEI
jgi:hypothetical protein